VADDFDALKYGHDSYVIVEPTHGAVDKPWKARERDSNLAAYGDTKEDAIQRLCGQYRTVARQIEIECLPAQPHWDHRVTAQLTAAGLSWEHARIAVGLLAEHRQMAWMDGVQRGFESGHAFALSKPNTKPAAQPPKLTSQED